MSTGSPLLAAACGAFLLAVAPARAGDTSAWDGDATASARLLGGERLANGDLRAGVEIRLAPGWVTYWRYPGDAGVPPRFDFSGSANLAAATVLWPTPARIEKGGVTSIGYHGDVVFPLHLTPREPGKPVTLRLKLDYGVCEKVCIPAQAAASLSIAGDAATVPALVRAERNVPTPTKLGEPTAPLAIRSVERDGSNVVVDVNAPKGETVDLFAEGPSDDWALPLPKPVAGAPAGTQRFTFQLDGVPPGARTDKVDLRLTAATPARGIETIVHLD